LANRACKKKISTVCLIIGSFSFIRQSCYGLRVKHNAVILFKFQMKKKYIIIVFLSFFHSYSTNAQGLDTIQNSKFVFAPSVGGQFELSTFLYVFELGALIDIDLFRKESKLDYSFGTRLSYESYAYFEPGGPTGGGPFKDYCFYIIHSARSERYYFNIFG